MLDSLIKIFHNRINNFFRQHHFYSFGVFYCYHKSAAAAYIVVAYEVESVKYYMVMGYFEIVEDYFVAGYVVGPYIAAYAEVNFAEAYVEASDQVY